MPSEQLLTYRNYVDKSHPDLSEEERLADMVKMRSRPYFNKTELLWLAKNITLFKKVTNVKSTLVGRGGSKVEGKSASDSRILKKFSTLEEHCFL